MTSNLFTKGSGMIPSFKMFFILPVLGFILLYACNPSSGESDKIPGDKTLVASSPLLKLLTPDETGISFRNMINETFELNITTHINTSNGGGVAILDANNDGLQDVYFISTSGENKFFLNLGTMKFKDITSTAGLASEKGFEVAVTAADVNHDGFMDIYICRAGPVVDEERRNKLFINNGDLTFTERAKDFGLDDKSASIGANFFDYDLDGDLDLYLLNYPIDFGYASKINVKPNADGTGVEPILDPILEYDTDRFYRNDGPPQKDGTGGFKDVSKEAGIWNFGFGLSVSVEDFNQDGWLDVYVANDFITPDLLYINNQDGTFTDRLKDYFKHTTQHSMGTDLADFDNDGLFDLFAVDMLSETQYRKKTLLSTNSQNRYTTLIRNGYFEPVVRNVLQRNNGNFTFSDLGCMANVFQTDWSWSGLMADMDNDGWKDILVTNGYQREVTDVDFINFTFAEIKAKGSLKNQFKEVHDFLNMIPQYKLRDYVFRNNGDWTFEDKSGEWLTTPATWSNGAATADLDNDGDLEYLVNNIGDEAFVYQNLSSDQNNHHYLQVSFKGPSLNPFAIGTSVRIFIGDQQQYSMVSPSRGIFSSVEYLIHFGIGQDTLIDRLEVRWPDGKMQTLNQVSADQRLHLNYTDAIKPLAVTKEKPVALFKAITESSGLKFRHQENDYVDFENTFLMPWALSDLGPLMTTADVNKDGLTDVYIGNSFGKSSGLYVQKTDGTFTLLSKNQWEADSIYEDHGALFFDADMDGDVDLFVISGGYESVSPQAWQCRLYINENGNNFIHARGAIPLLKDVCMRAVAFDYDADGDNDLFVGGRVVPGKYPSTPESYILRNDRNKFVEVAGEVSAEFQKTGMVTDLQIANVDGDPDMELVVIGEWMPITIFNLGKGKIEKQNLKSLGLDFSNGFWNKLVIADMDGDGDKDIITGNLGMNSQYKPSVQHPVQCYVSDYDANGSLDPIITYFEDDKCYPLVQKDVLIKQIPALKKKFVYSKDYAKATISDVLSSKQIKESLILNAYMVESGWWENTGGKFIFHAFPNQAQVSPLQGIIVHDFNHDTHPDLFLAGNKYRMEVETARLDSGIGTYLQGNGKGQFTWVNNLSTGLWAPYDVRDLALLMGPQNKVRIVVSNNDNLVQVYEEMQ
jgi:enediyne biosynthesis protein E4